MIKIDVLDKKKAMRREKNIKAILARGCLAKFTNKSNGIVKLVDTWNIDKDGDLTAISSTGQVLSVAWDSPQYTLTAIQKTVSKK